MTHFERIDPEGDFPYLMGAYSHGVKVPLPGADLIFLTGQKAVDSAGHVIAPGDPEKQTEYVFENTRKLLEAAGATMEHVVKAQIYVLNMQDFPIISKVRNRYFENVRPASVMVQVGALAKPGCVVEVAVTAVVPHR
ncbi:MAG: RidA family protein [Candidatus Zixiibacteriota bacterium]|nr:MAG: RidA family protein [candidate division Zixibacteria bacterium]